ncbi:uncharacterized protein LOC125940978 [Dermacentor silvarum]|uniref:uncharacterized protein LOC125940978 n=1 Tax=Dermacentor silvarum TaxID=543639 RepID=UPI0021018030|nr:uncharacterized protein LOC125940978 [Dermacentor silvarum]
MSGYPVCINGQRISYKRNHRFLGVFVDRDLSWSPQLAHLKKKLTSLVNVFKFIAGKTWGSSVGSMLQLYRALFIGYLRYSSPVLTKTCKSKLQALQSVQAQELRVCLDLPRSPSTAGTVIMAQDHPITTCMTIDTLRAHIRHVSRMQSSSLASLPERRSQASFSNVVNIHGASLPSGFTSSTRSLSALWSLKQPDVRLYVPGIRKKTDLSTLALKQAALDCLHTFYFDRIPIYTDGSSAQTSSTGAVVISRSMSITYETCHVTSSTASELVALRGAIDYINNQPANRWSILCDSRAPLQCLLSALHRGSYEQLVSEIREMHHHTIAKGHDVVFQWLPTHCGISGNNIADEAARKAHEGANLVSVSLSRTDAAQHLSKLAHRMTLEKWHSTEFTQHRLHSLDPSIPGCCLASAVAWISAK